MWKIGLKAFSLAHILMIFFWFTVAGNGFVFPTELCRSEIVSFLLILFFLSFIFFGFSLWNFSKTIKNLGYLFCAFIVLRGIKVFLHFEFDFNINSAIFCVLISILIFLSIKKRVVFDKIIHQVVLFFVPFAFFTITMLVFEITQISKPFLLAEKISGEKERFFWIIFDELDENLIFTLRPENQAFPALEQFRSESICCPQALQPAGCTTISLPSYLFGKNMTEVVYKSSRDLILKDKNAKNYHLRKTALIFDKVQKLKYNSAFLGWYLPYDLWLTEKVNYFSLYTKPVHAKTSIWPTKKQVLSHVGMFLQFNFQKFFQKIFHVSCFQNMHWNFSKYKIKHEDAYEKLCESIRKIISDQSLQFVFLHLPYPHYPTIYDPKEDKIVERSPCYYDNVHLVDKVLSMMRQELENQGMWDRATILVISDHWLRIEPGFIDEFLNQEKEDFHVLMAKRKKPLVPFMLKLPYQKKGIKYDKEMNAVIAHDLMLYLMQGSPKSSEEVIKFFDKNRIAF